MFVKLPSQVNRDALLKNQGGYSIRIMSVIMFSLVFSVFAFSNLKLLLTYNALSKAQNDLAFTIRSAQRLAQDNQCYITMNLIASSNTIVLKANKKNCQQIFRLTSNVEITDSQIFQINSVGRFDRKGMIKFGLSNSDVYKKVTIVNRYGRLSFF